MSRDVSGVAVLARRALALTILAGSTLPGAQAQVPAREEPPPVEVVEEAGRERPEPPGEEPQEPTPEEASEASEEQALARVWNPASVERRGVLSADLGSGCLITLPTEVERVAVADETIARVQVISSQEVLVTALEPGRTTLHVWLTDGRRMRYLFQARRNLDLLRKVLQDLDPGIAVEANPDGSSVVLAGEVADGQTAESAAALAERLLRAPGTAGGIAQVVNLLRYPVSTSATDLWLTEALHAIDPRIRVRRIQVGPEPAVQVDSYILEGRVRNIKALVRAVILAERQLGSTGVGVSAPGPDLTFQRNRGFFGVGGDAGLGGGQGGLQALSGLGRPPSGLAAQVARGLIITSESGRVLSLLEVDELPQIMVSIRVYQVDRGKAKKAGINFRFDSEHVSFGSFTGPQVGSLPRLLDSPPDVGTITGGNLVGAFVDEAFAIAAAIDWLQEKNLARSVAEPNILTLSGEEATVLVGGEVPIPTTAVGQVATVQGFFFQDFGVRLDIRPTLDEQGIVALEVSPSIIRPAPGLGVGEVPGFQVQSVQTTARVPAGQSLVLGGLLSFDEGLEEARVPVLGKIPLFRWRRKSRQEQELLFVITPRVVAMPEVQPVEPVEPPSAEQIALPDLEWPEDRDGWKEEFEPRLVGPDGVPESFRRPAGEGPAPPPEPAPAPEPAPPSPEPVPQGLPEGRELESQEVSEPEVAAAEPEAEPVPAPEPELWIVGEEASPCLHLRPRAGLWSKPLDCLPPGTPVRLFERGDGWWWVGLPDGREGWMAGFYLTPAPEDPPAPEDR